MKVYLCGPINGRTDAECNDWRTEAERLLVGHETISPMCRDYRGREDANIDAIVEGDKADIEDCDVVLVYFDRPSVGTSMEILYAWEKCKWVIVAADPSLKLSPWLRYHSHAIRPTLAEAAKEVESCK